MKSVILMPGRGETALGRRHPWVFSGAIKEAEDSIRIGETVDVFAESGAWLGRGAYSPHSQIRIRIWSFDSEETVSESFFAQRLERAILSRKPYLSNAAPACRIVNAESDGLPGLIVDRYDDFLACQFLSAGVEYWKDAIVNHLKSFPGIRGIYERSDADIRLKEGLELHKGVLMGQEPPELVEIQEADIRLYVDIRNGHKTGFYLDQRENRAMIPQFSEGKDVLNCFSYTGGFGIWALKGRALRVVNIDSSQDALTLAGRNSDLNGFNSESTEQINGNVFEVLRTFRDSRRQFDMIILDPPKFVESRSQITKGGRAYKDINMLAIKLLAPGGILFTFSCSGLIDSGLFQKIVFDAALDAGRDVQIIRYLGQAEDHPIALNFPEGRYLKGLICRAG